jgi:asparagine synthetase B (glutamine-hydrolysing)
VSELRGLIREAVHAALPAAAVGALVSGGIDSAAVYALADDPAIPCFTGYYEHDGFYELGYAGLVAGREWHRVKITPDDFVSLWDEAIECFRPPWQGPGMFGQWMVARHAAACGVDVLLSGEGGDELFGGYVRLQIVAGLERRPGYEDYRLPDGYPDNVEDALAYDWERLPDLLAVDDQACGAFGIEAVAPMLAPPVVEYAMGLPAVERVGKVALRDAVRGWVPDPILDRRDKMGFPIPLTLWAQEEPVRSFVRERIGYVPDPARPFDRGWFHGLCNASVSA